MVWAALMENKQVAELLAAYTEDFTPEYPSYKGRAQLSHTAGLGIAD